MNAQTPSVPEPSRSLDLTGESLWTAVRRTVNASVLIPIVLFSSLLIALLFLAGSSFSLTLLESMLETTTPLLLVAMGQTLVALTGGIDLAVGGVMSVCATLLATRMTTNGDIAMWLPLILLIGLGCGAINGLLLHTTKIQSFIVTLASWSVLSGIALEILPTEGGTVAPGLSSALMGNIAGVPKSVWILVVLLLLFQLLRRTRFGTAVYAVGGNEEAARLNGLRLARTKIVVYALSGLFAALAAVFYVGDVALSASPVSGDPFILQSVAAVVIGGTSLFGGKGGYFGTVLGAMSLTVIGSIVFFSNVQSYYGQLLQGVLLVGAVLLYSIVDTVVRRRSLTRGR